MPCECVSWRQVACFKQDENAYVGNFLDRGLLDGTEIMDTFMLLHIILQPFTVVLGFVCEIEPILPINPSWFKT